MDALEVELAGLQARLVTDPANKALVTRRISEVKSAINADSKATAPQIETPGGPEVETATLPAKKRK